MIDTTLTLEAIEAIRDTATWTRADYEAMAAAHATPTREDRHMDSIVKYNDDIHTTFYAFAAARLRHLQAEAAAKPPRPITPRPPIQLIACACGHSVPQALVMSASLGTTCPDCFDDWSS